jgi:hypothetical protein
MNLRLSTFALLLAMGVGAAVPAGAQQVDVNANVEFGPHNTPLYQTWQPQWDAWRFDHRHVILGTVASFAPYRLTVNRRDGVTQTVDLKNGTIILPTGATPTATQRVAVVGYYSKGTFICNRVILRN